MDDLVFFYGDVAAIGSECQTNPRMLNTHHFYLWESGPCAGSGKSKMNSQVYCVGRNNVLPKYHRILTAFIIV